MYQVSVRLYTLVEDEKKASRSFENGTRARLQYEQELLQTEGLTQKALARSLHRTPR